MRLEQYRINSMRPPLPPNAMQYRINSMRPPLPPNRKAQNKDREIIRHGIYFSL